MLGWVLVGTGLRPRGKAWLGTALSAVRYIWLGLIWVLFFNAVVLGTSMTGLLEPRNLPTGLLIASIWPLQVAQVLGLFHLSLG